MNLDDVVISVDADKLLLAEQGRYLGRWARNDLSWDEHFLGLCWQMSFYVHMFLRLTNLP